MFPSQRTHSHDRNLAWTSYSRNPKSFKGYSCIVHFRDKMRNIIKKCNFRLKLFVLIRVVHIGKGKEKEK